MNLSRLAAYRRQMEDIERVELADSARRLHEAAARVAALEADVAAQQQRYVEAGEAGLTAEEARTWYVDIGAACGQMERAAAVHEALHHAWREKQAAVLAAMQERKKLDIVMERRREAAQLAVRRADQSLMDDQAARRRAVNRPSAPAVRNPPRL